MKDPEGIKTIPWGLSEKNLLDLTPINSPLSLLEQDKIKVKKDSIEFACRTMFDIKCFDTGISMTRARELYDEYFSQQPENWK